MALIYCDGDNKLAESWAKQAAEVLVSKYPNHSWWVECRGGALIIKHFGITGERIGMVRHTAALSRDWRAFRTDISRAAGELLERAGVKRGAFQGEAVKNLELEDAKTQRLWRARPPVSMKVIH